jgi:curved DNA-binding protein CbpA
VQTGTTHYETLGVSAAAPASEIRSCYVTLARLYHPDFQIGKEATARAEAEARMRDINVAWNVLGDRTRRHVYDRQLDKQSAKPSLSSSRPEAAGVSGSRRRWADRHAGDGRAPALLLAVAVAVLCLGVVLGSNLLLASGLGCALCGGAASVRRKSA